MNITNYLVFTPAKKYMKYFHGIIQIYLQRSNGMPEEDTENITKSDSSFAPTFNYHHVLPVMATV